MASRTMAELAEALRELAEEFVVGQHSAQGRDGSLHEGTVEAKAFAPAPGEVIVVWLPAHAGPPLAGDLSRFIAAQVGDAFPVIVTLAADVTAEKQGG